MVLLGEASDGSGWAVIGTLATLLVTVIITARRDRRAEGTEAARQWRQIAAAEAERVKDMEAEMELMLARERVAIAKAARQEEQLAARDELTARLRREIARLEQGDTE